MMMIIFPHGRRGIAGSVFDAALHGHARLADMELPPSEKSYMGSVFDAELNGHALLALPLD